MVVVVAAAIVIIIFYSMAGRKSLGSAAVPQLSKPRCGPETERDSFAQTTRSSVF